MTKIYQCNSCMGTYPETNPDSTQNFHACGPIPNPDFQPDPTQPGFDPRQQIERPDKRDENIRPDVVYFDGKPCIVARDPADPTRRVTTPAD